MLARLDLRDARADLAARLGIGTHDAGPADAVTASVAAIVDAVRTRGDAAVREFTERFDGATLDRFRVTEDECRAAVEATPTDVRNALEVAAGRISEYHQAQV
ncbi:MAG: histidinol dehydrogenase, partial [Acidimicrobiia bacterium]